MGKMWAGRFLKAADKQADDFNSSIHFDCKMYRQDITGSMAHAAMLGAQGIIGKDESEKIIDGLQGILDDLDAGKIEIDMTAEDIHMFVEQVLTERLGDLGKKLHTARSRNDQVAVDIRLYMRDEADEVIALLKDLLKVIRDKAEANKDIIMPGYTHLQRAQPITFGHHLLAYAFMLTRDITRVKDAKARMNYSPLGSAALSGTTHNIDRYMTAEKLGFDGITLNSIDGVSDRDFCVELMSAFALVMMHLSRLSEEIILWSSWEFKFVELDDAYTTGSSIMPQKKNPDMAELVRGKTGRVYGDLMALLTTLKGIPLAYNKDMQEDKEAIFDSVETVKKCVSIMIPLIDTMQPVPANMRAAAQKGFINATDLADYLVGKGIPFRAAYKTVGQIVAYCIANGKVLETMTIEEYKNFDATFGDDLFAAIDLDNCVKKRISAGSTGPDSVANQLRAVEKFLEEN